MMVRYETKWIADGRVIKNSDVTGFTKYQDAVSVQNRFVVIGEIDVPTNSLGATWGGGGPIFLVIFDNQTTAVRQDGVFSLRVANQSGKEQETHLLNSRQVGATGQRSDPSKWVQFLPRGTAWAPAGGQLLMYFSNESASNLTEDSTDHQLDAFPYTIKWPD